MYAFAPNTPFTASKAVVGKTSFTSPLPAQSESRPTAAPTMVLRTVLRSPVPSGAATVYGYVGRGNISVILAKADEYMAKSVRKQYLAKSNPYGTFGVQCTEGSVKFAADFSRIRALNAEFRAKLGSASKKTFDMYENRKNAISNSHGCHHEETQFVGYKGVSSMYNVSKSEASGSCSRYASPETVVEAAMLRFMDIQVKMAANPTGVYNISCNEGAARGQAEDVRVAALNAAFRQGQKSLGKLLDEKYQQKKQGYSFAHGCNYEEGLINKYPALGAAFRSKSYGY
uniref:LR gamma5 n=1 Tax=Griffithsia pacifica TaxID=35689 RepID=A0A291FEC5_GRIPA|nr:Chain 44, LR_gamma5 [Griffithsia pacifica]5Y6P_C2 Chain C2, LR_gamma5 [Griffithsia pacifica]5Y6P_D2 Chain D2, LR_gamma5 [Griffithsia pacifica]5Y6P_T8 Chain T8, LR_gamma5 [Griffithsia pacifica]5Y6P_Y9 Chain Y9, LR_gamma5 [Griffithsia pacifica]5Y6P_Z5 Chain Z5, LR_gamma5 [Griffithsia pacifica]5Y6P_aZ Chain aZ, LR_gamma5 [Griffithsia pacifica]5Y6P_bZ Chain bZ, LR_gamma5 [Griffithsia pacifica]5Y6P_c3 Chain c3, LR_gamma5 [Griffithsia pacifica]5Y6P_c8 Chain c8, LR_gamma5 [Griffithsia pacifica